jgi:hypothetical protein
MKKAILLISVLMLSACAFGQPHFGSSSETQTTETMNNTFEDDIRNGCGYWTRYINIKMEKFIYIVAYEPIFKRGLFRNTTRVVNLYCKDTTDVKNPWIVVCDSVITNYYNDWENYQVVDFLYYSEKNNESHSEILMDEENLLVYLDVWIMKDNCFKVTRTAITLKKVRTTHEGMIFYTTIK